MFPLLPSLRFVTETFRVDLGRSAELSEGGAVGAQPSSMGAAVDAMNVNAAHS